MTKIFHRWTGGVLFEAEGTLIEVLTKAAADHANLAREGSK